MKKSVVFWGGGGPGVVAQWIKRRRRDPKVSGSHRGSDLCRNGTSKCNDKHQYAMTPVAPWKPTCGLGATVGLRNLPFAKL